MRFSLKSRYRDPADPISYSGLSKIRKHENIKLKALKNILSSVPEYTSFREQKKT